MSADEGARRRIPSWVRNLWMVAAMLGVFVYLGSFALLIRSFAFQPFSMTGNSMAPNLVRGELVVTAKYAYGYSRHSFAFSLFPIEGRIWGKQPQRGDIVIFKDPRDTRLDFVKRVVGLPGEKIQMIGGVLHIDEEPVDLVDIGPFDVDGNPATLQMETLPEGVAYSVLSIVEQGLADDTRAFIVPAGHYFMLGDNRDNSLDSRFDVGFVPFENLVGRVAW